MPFGRRCLAQVSLAVPLLSACAPAGGPSVGVPPEDGSRSLVRPEAGQALRRALSQEQAARWLREAAVREWSAWVEAERRCLVDGRDCDWLGGERMPVSGPPALSPGRAEPGAGASDAELSSGRVAGAQLDGTDLYILRDRELILLSLADPSAPRERGRVSLPFWPEQLQVQGGWALVVGRAQSLRAGSDAAGRAARAIDQLAFDEFEGALSATGGGLYIAAVDRGEIERGGAAHVKAVGAAGMELTGLAILPAAASDAARHVKAGMYWEHGRDGLAASIADIRESAPKMSAEEIEAALDAALWRAGHAPGTPGELRVSDPDGTDGRPLCEASDVYGLPGEVGAGLELIVDVELSQDGPELRCGLVQVGTSAAGIDGFEGDEHGALLRRVVEGAGSGRGRCELGMLFDRRPGGWQYVGTFDTDICIRRNTVMSEREAFDPGSGPFGHALERNLVAVAHQAGSSFEETINPDFVENIFATARTDTSGRGFWLEVRDRTDGANGFPVLDRAHFTVAAGVLESDEWGVARRAGVAITAAQEDDVISYALHSGGLAAFATGADPDADGELSASSTLTTEGRWVHLEALGSGRYLAFREWKAEGGDTGDPRKVRQIEALTIRHLPTGRGRSASVSDRELVGEGAFVEVVVGRQGSFALTTASDGARAVYAGRVLDKVGDDGLGVSVIEGITQFRPLDAWGRCASEESGGDGFVVLVDDARDAENAERALYVIDGIGVQVYAAEAVEAGPLALWTFSGGVECGGGSSNGADPGAGVGSDPTAETGTVGTSPEDGAVDDVGGAE